MSAETDIYTLLSADAPVIALVDTRIYPDFVPEEKTLPAIAISREETEFFTTVQNSVASISKVSLEIWCMGATRASAEQVGDAAQLALGAGGIPAFDRRQEMNADLGLFSAVLSVHSWQ